ncbi:helix-turn-helix domain-containing protein [Natronorubrum aibiense]|uniref:Helix-turn-helix domain-containing protein n=1 Tax=Natronorubrum aibiense TaxID=348826 RepID=A0A5P9P9C9_9EURY|nr:helix-turn-helix domain-containing protein [Natronorubrum aibiense]QFU84749.1 helix-turn-helix domain-containing protein [Natronorubrum aibiense]
MPNAELTITVPDRVWIGELSRKYPDAVFEILTAFPKDMGGVALAEITHSDVGTVLQTMNGYDEVTNIDLLQQTSDNVLVQFETSSPLLLFPVREAGTPLELPFTVTDGTVDWEITATRERLSLLADQLREFGITFDVKSITHQVEMTQLLSVKQTELMERAIERGYYDTPRRVTLTELAEDVDIAKSTCSETLHRAEEKIIKQFATDTNAIETNDMVSPTK